MVGGWDRETEGRLTISDSPPPRMRMCFSEPALPSSKAIERVSLREGRREARLTRG